MIHSKDFNVQSSLEANYLNVPLDDSVELDEIAVKVLIEECPDFLIPFRVMSHDGMEFLKYRLLNSVALKYCNLRLSSSAFTQMYLSLLRPFLEGKDWFLNYHNLCIDKSYVYLSKDLTTVSYIYIPDKSYRNSNEEILAFFQSILDDVVITDDGNLGMRLYQYFRRGDVTLIELYRMVEEENKKYGGVVAAKEAGRATDEERAMASESVSARKNKIQDEAMPIWKEEEPISEPGGKEKRKWPFGRGRKKTEKEEKKEILSQEESYSDVDSNYSDDDVMKILFGRDDEKKKKEKLFQNKEKGSAGEKSKGWVIGKKKAETGSESGDALAGQERQDIFEQPQPNVWEQPKSNAQQDFTEEYTGGDDEATEIYDDDTQESRGYLELINAPIPGAPEKIALGFDKPFITLGRTSQNVVKPDVEFGSELRKIGRMHARIERNGDGYCVIDLGSTNHTLLNGQVLVPNHPYPLQSGDELALTTNMPVRYRVNL